MKLRFDKTENGMSGVELWTTKYGAPQKKSYILVFKNPLYEPPGAFLKLTMGTLASAVYK